MVLIQFEISASKLPRARDYGNADQSGWLAARCQRNDKFS